MRGRAQRRADMAAMKKRVRLYHCFPTIEKQPWNEKRIGKLATTPAPCSCSMCGNRRKHEGPTAKERLER